MRTAFALSTALLLLPGPSAAADEPDWLAPIVEDATADHWSRRWAAALALAARAGGEDLFAIRPLLLRDERAPVRAAVAWAAVLEPKLLNATLLGLALRRDEAPAVRYAAAAALAHHRDRRAVEALVEALATERNRRVRLRIAATLRALTPAPCLLDAGDWSAWWAKHGDAARFQPADEAAKRKEYEGVPLETRTVAAVPAPADDAARHRDILVLPPFGFTNAVYGPYLLPLRRHAGLTFVQLPTVQELTGETGYGQDIPTYPVDRLARALDRYCEEAKIGKSLVLAPGASGWIAMRFAQLYPRRVEALLLLDCALDKEAYAAALLRGSAKGNPGERFTADTLTHRNRAPFTRRTLDRLQAYGLENGFHDAGDLEIGDLYAHGREPQGFATVPDLRWGKRARLDVPALFVYSAASPFSGHGDRMRITRHFPNAMVTPLSGTRALPYIEENERFVEIVEAFLEKHAKRD